MATIKTGFWALRTAPLPDFLLELCNVLEYVAIKALLQRAEVGALWLTFETLSPKQLQQECRCQAVRGIITR